MYTYHEFSNALGDSEWVKITGHKSRTREVYYTCPPLKLACQVHGNISSESLIGRSRNVYLEVTSESEEVGPQVGSSETVTRDYLHYVTGDFRPRRYDQCLLRWDGPADTQLTKSMSLMDHITYVYREPGVFG